MKESELFSNEEELPEELKDIDESYFEELAQKGKISTYYKNDGTTVEYVSKRKFRKKLKEEKSQIYKDRSIMKNTILILIIPLIVLEIIKEFHRCINDYEIRWVRYLIILIGLIPIVSNLVINNFKIKRMYNKFVSKKEYINTEKISNRFFLVFCLIISIICLTYAIDWNLTAVTGSVYEKIKM